MRQAHHGNGYRLGGLTTAFLLGALTGSAAAFLTAPKSGRRTRRAIGKEGRRWRRRALGSAAATMGRSQKALDRAGRALAATAEEVKHAARSWAR